MIQVAFALITLASATVAPFSFHLLIEPSNLDPQMTASASGNYLLFNLYRGLMRYSEQKGLITDGAEKCVRKKLTVLCDLRADRKWSSGQPITASDYVASFRRLISPELGSPQASVLFGVKNALPIWQKQKPVEQLGVHADGPLKLRIELDKEDYEFEYKLIHPALSPLPPDGFKTKAGATSQVTSGPYSIGEWKANSWLKLKNNPHYSAFQRPDVTVYFVDEDATALRLYETGKMTFLRRVTGEEIPRLRKSPEFRQISMSRFDYIGFGPQLYDKPKLREALVKSIDFKMFFKMFDSISQPGCPSLPAKLMDKVPCIEPELADAKKRLDDYTIPLKFFYSLMGGDDIARAAAFFQGQWKKNLGLQVEVRPEEQGMYLRHLKTDPPTIFRKGVSLDRPTCLAGLELFTKNHPDNYIHLDDPEYEKRVKDVGLASTENSRKVACRRAMEYLNTTNRLIPLGEMQFSIMAKPAYVGWSLNSLNQLDLTELAPALAL